MPNEFEPESDSDDELPLGWEERAEESGRVYYINHNEKKTQWTHPKTGASKRVSGELPKGWTKEIESETGEIIFVNTTNGVQTYIDPRLAFAAENLPKDISDIRQRFDSNTKALPVLWGLDQTGKVAVITGANCGIGFETARSLALFNCRVVFACRSEERAMEAIARIAAEKPAAGKLCSFVPLDLESLDSVRRAAEKLIAEFDHIDMLILNAAVFALPYSLTGDGLETTFQVCHLSHFYFTKLLERCLNWKSRVVVLSSESHRFSSLPPKGLNEQDLSPPPYRFRSMTAYNNVKLCNVLFARGLAKRWYQKGVCVNALHPGNMVSSHLSRNWWFYKLIFFLVRPFTKSLQQAAATTIYCAVAPELTGISGQYFNNCFFCEPSKLSQNDELVDELWELSEQIINRIIKEKQRN